MKVVYPTLKAIRMEWIITFAQVGNVLLLSCIAIGFLSGLFFKNPSYLAYCAGVGLILSFIFTIAYQIIFFNFVKCPSCHEKLNKFKNGNNVPSKQAHTQLENGFGCRYCGWKP